ncbi:MAG TPA: dTDP-4-dehydrorhamnose 3,5-epimerase [Thermodesulfovibrionales bacterium]|nr:dTDP-4-dehydrorhamnose 3,5-epimerase [Thermodesulfovibrionales bacterium]
MIFTETRLRGAYVIDPEPLSDDRGFFARTWCQKEFQAHGLNTNVAQCNISYNAKKGTLRGMHYQTAPFEEAKLVRCTGGAIFDVIIDLRPHSATFREWISVELDAGNRRMFYIPEGFAHGFITLTDNAEVFYQMSQCYSAGHARGVRWNDPVFGIQWPAEASVISEKDRQFPDFMP